MTFTLEQLNDLERQLLDLRGNNISIGSIKVLRLVAIARAALAWSDARRCVDYDSPFQRGEAERKLAAALRGDS